MNLLTAAPIAGLAVLVSWFVVTLLYDWASQHLLDIPNERSSHVRPTPKGGGLSIVLTSLLLLIGGALFLVPDGLSMPILIYIIAGAMIAAVGWIDDRRDLDPQLRLLLQIAAALGVILAARGGIQAVHLPLAGVIILPTVVALLLNLTWIVGLVNAYNFMDGIDGLAGIQAVVASGTWFFLLYEVPILQLLALLICFSSAGFLILNWPPAKIFMGDVGSTFLGLTLGTLPLLAYAAIGNPDVFVTGVLLVAPFVFDAALTIIRRLLNKEPILKPHRSHLYQRLVKAGYSHRVVTSVYGILMLLCAGLGLVYYYSGEGIVKWVAILIVASLCCVLTFSTTRIEKRKPLQQLS